MKEQRLGIFERNLTAMEEFAMFGSREILLALHLWNLKTTEMPKVWIADIKPNLLP